MENVRKLHIDNEMPAKNSMLGYFKLIENRHGRDFAGQPRITLTQVISKDLETIKEAIAKIIKKDCRRKVQQWAKALPGCLKTTKDLKRLEKAAKDSKL